MLQDSDDLIEQQEEEKSSDVNISNDEYPGEYPGEDNQGGTRKDTFMIDREQFQFEEQLEEEKSADSKIPEEDQQAQNEPISS